MVYGMTRLPAIAAGYTAIAADISTKRGLDLTRGLLFNEAP
jgi:hypothetical protein